ncbi:MAG TPA: hypothetical protein VK487_04650 [Candidatus Bathyarchaeia archaeon]|nr:hypothetical protein [Candidatus Bathyarchaeia archaeon]
MTNSKVTVVLLCDLCRAYTEIEDIRFIDLPWITFNICKDCWNSKPELIAYLRERELPIEEAQEWRVKTTRFKILNVRYSVSGRRDLAEVVERFVISTMESNIATLVILKVWTESTWRYFERNRMTGKFDLEKPSKNSNFNFILTRKRGRRSEEAKEGYYKSRGWKDRSRSSS